MEKECYAADSYLTMVMLGKHLNAEFQRIARRDKKGFFSNQCKEIEENNRMVFINKSRKILRRGGKNIQKNYTKKIFMTQITMMV